jgi:hypothetical protein
MKLKNQKRGAFGVVVLLLMFALNFYAEHESVIAPIVHDWLGVEVESPAAIVPGTTSVQRLGSDAGVE